MIESKIMPLVRYLSLAGLGSRRKCDQIILEGRVAVNKEKAVPGMKVTPGKDLILVDGKRTDIVNEPVCILLNKPKGYLVTDSDPQGRPLANLLLPDLGCRLFSSGRLDFQSEGAVIFTNDGIWAQNISHPRNRVIKTYLVKLHGIPTAGTLRRWILGIRDQGELLRAVKVVIVRKTSKNSWLEVHLSGGINRQIRRMAENTGHNVNRLIRTSIGGIELGDLKPGQYRFLTRKEVLSMKRSSKSLKNDAE